MADAWPQQVLDGTQGSIRSASPRYYVASATNGRCYIIPQICETAQYLAAVYGRAPHGGGSIRSIPDGNVAEEPLLVTIDLDSIKFS